MMAPSLTCHARTKVNVSSSMFDATLVYSMRPILVTFATYIARYNSVAMAFCILRNEAAVVRMFFILEFGARLI